MAKVGFVRDKETTEETPNKLAFAAVEMQKREIPVLVEECTAGKDYVNYGKENNYPQFLYKLYINSSLLQSIINGMSRYIMGDGFVCADELERLKDKANRDFETVDDVLSKIIMDLLLYGGFGLEILRNSRGGISEVFWIDFQKIRISKNGEFAYISNGWDKWSPKTTKLPLYTGKGTHELMYYAGNKTRGVYPIPLYSGALNAIQTSIEISKYHLKSILNDFQVSAIINFNNGSVSDEMAKDIEKKIEKKFCGADNANKFLLCFNESKENSAVIQRLEANNTDQKFLQLKEDITTEIFTAFSAQPSLYGMITTKNSFNREEFLQAFSVYQKTVIAPMQKEIEKVINKVFGGKVLDILPFTIEAVADSIEDVNNDVEINVE